MDSGHSLDDAVENSFQHYSRLMAEEMALVATFPYYHIHPALEKLHDRWHKDTFESFYNKGPLVFALDMAATIAGIGVAVALIPIALPAYAAVKIYEWSKN